MGALLLHEQPYAEGLLITEHGEAARLLGVGVPWVLEFGRVPHLDVLFY